ncbi:pilus assembly protein TadG-related protein [Methylobacterium sp. JK268]
MSGNVGLIVAFCLIPFVGLIGLCIDYGLAISSKVKLDAAADAAALAAVATAKAYIAANASAPDAWKSGIEVGRTKGANTFAVNAGTTPFTQYTLAPIDLQKSGRTLSATVSYSGSMAAKFGPIFGIRSMAVEGKAVARTDVPSYLDFFLLIDVSGSMGLPSTPEGQSSLASYNNDMFGDYKQGCQFACHFPGYNGYDLALKYGIQLRSGAVNVAVCNLIRRASKPLVANQYRIGLYPFISEMATLQPISLNMSALSSKAGCGSNNPAVFTELLDTGVTQLAVNGDPSTGTGSGGTHFEAVLRDIATTIAASNGFGDGLTQAKPKPFIFLITDGMQNNQRFIVSSSGKYIYSGNPSRFREYGDARWSDGGSQPSVIDPSLCTALKNSGATISILYIPYIRIEFVDRGGGVAAENKKVNAFSPSVPNALSACASSPDYFHTAGSPDAIDKALDAMFFQANQVTHLAE